MNLRKVIFFVILFVIFFSSCLYIVISAPTLKDTSFSLLENVEALANGELVDKNKYEKTESTTKTVVNDAQAHYYLKHVIVCKPGGIIEHCTPVCETCEVVMGNPSPWKKCD